MHKKLITVAKKLEKASKAHAGQARTLRSLARKKAGSRRKK
jgi:hypothetical protein|tara:strand:- start:1902 stop:2024 length:123 start_codon:yes stop_codon:yes gene_type:complete